MNRILLKKQYFALGLIILLAAALRFYRLPDMANYDFDQEYAANFAYSVLKVYPIQLIGQGLSVQGLFMGPWYFYFLTPFFALTNLHPLGGYIGSIIFSLVIILTYFFVTRELFGVNAALVAAFLRSILFSKIDGDWTMVPSYASEVTVLITWLCFYKYWHGKVSYWPLLFFMFGLYTSIHPINFPFYLVFLILFLIIRKLPDPKTALQSIIMIAAPVIPLFIFEYFHNFLEIKRLFSVYGGSGTAETRDITRLLSYVHLNTHEFYNILSLFQVPEGIFTILFFVVVISLIIKRVDFLKDSFHLVLLPISWIVFIVYYTLFPTHVPEYYFIGLFTLTLLYLSAFLGLLAKKRILFPILVLILLNITISNFKALEDKWNNPSLITLSHKDFIVQQVAKHQPQNQEFFISYIKLPGWNFGFDYLFKIYNLKAQTRDAKPPIYTIVIPKYLSPGSSDVESGNIGLILPK